MQKKIIFFAYSSFTAIAQLTTKILFHFLKISIYYQIENINTFLLEKLKKENYKIIQNENLLNFYC